MDEYDSVQINRNEIEDWRAFEGLILLYDLQIVSNVSADYITIEGLSESVEEFLYFWEHEHDRIV